MQALGLHPLTCCRTALCSAGFRQPFVVLRRTATQISKDGPSYARSPQQNWQKTLDGLMPRHWHAYSARLVVVGIIGVIPTHNGRNGIGQAVLAVAWWLLVPQPSARK